MAKVAPRTGAWIETSKRHLQALSRKSPPARGRGLKLLNSFLAPEPPHVAPRTGAWIETNIGVKGGADNARRPPHGGVD